MRVRRKTEVGMSVLAVVLVSGMMTACATLRSGETMGEGEQEAVWVCHGNRNPRWLKVAAPAADGHRRHGDRVSTSPRPEGETCRKQATSSPGTAPNWNSDPSGSALFDTEASRARTQGSLYRM